MGRSLVMKKVLLTLGLVAPTLAAAAADVTFTGASHEVIAVTPERNTGLDRVFVAFDSSELSAMVISGVSGAVEVSRYSNLGGGYAEPVAVRYEGGNALVDGPQGDMGYIIRDGDTTVCVWLVNYAAHRLVLQSAAAAAVQECENTSIEITGSGAAIYYYTIDGRREELGRDIEVKYSNLEWSDDSEAYLQTSETKVLPHLVNPVLLTPPLYCNSTMSVQGDRFLSSWGMAQHIESGLVYANGVSVQTTAEQTNVPEDDPDSPGSNMIKTETQGMGGSAPCDISFRAYVTDAVVHNEWQIAADEQFDYIDYRFNEQNLDYSFTEEGTYYVRFVGSNADGTCEAYGETYTVAIGSSELRIPNAFTPNDDGINDEWKVGYRSLLSFHCTIFDRYGTQIISFDDPTKGWDGKYKGKLVKPGVYFYVIEATGADGKTYKKGGDINIIRSKRNTTTSTGGGAVQ